MKTVSAELQALLEGDTTNLCWIFQLHARDDTGDVFRLTTDNRDHVRAAGTYEANPGFQLSSLRVTSGGQATVVEITIGVDDSQTTVAKQDLIDGRFKRGLGRLYVADHSDPTAAALLIFKGFVGDISYDESGAILIEFRTRWAESRTLPIGKFGPSCRWFLGDARCGVDLSIPGDGYTKTATVASVTSRTQFTITVTEPRASGTDWYSNGALKFTSGANDGEAYDIRKWTSASNRIDLWMPSIKEIQVGDTMEIHPGCDKTTGASGCARFSNIPNFGGFNFLPPPDFNFGDSEVGEAGWNATDLGSLIG